MAIISGTTIEYETKKHGEITSAYTYNPFFTAWNNYTLDDSSANTLCRWSSPTQTINLQASANTGYVDIVWLYGDAAALDKVISVADDENDTLNVITKLDIQKYKLVIDGFYIVHASDAGVTSNTEYKTAGYELQENEYIRDYVTHWEAKDDPTDRTALTIPVLRYTVNDKIWYFEIPDMFPVQMNNDPRNNRLKSDLQDVVCITGDNMALGRAPMSALGTWTYPSLGKSFIVDKNEDFTFIFSNPSEQRNVVFIALSNIEAMLKSVALLGVYFEYDGTMYLGFMDESGQTTGEYLTADKWNTSAQWQATDINNYTEHNPPYVPPGPYDDDPWSGASFSGVGVGGAGAFARCYYMTATELANLRTWMSGVGVPEGFNPMAQIIGLSQVPVALSGDAPETVQFINSSAVYDPGVVSRVVDSGVSTQYSMGKPISYSLGSIDITRRMQERGEPYLDYSCQIELYLPLIGTFSLDTQAVMGRTLEAEAILDPISGTLAAYAWVSRDGQKLPVAYGSTTIGIDLPITAQQYSMSRAAAKQINAQFTASMLSSALTTVTAAAAAGSASSAAAGRAGAASGAGIQPASQFNSYAQSASIAGSQTAISQSGNIFGAFMEWGRAVRQLSYGNNTAIAGSFGGSMAQWSYPFNAYVKIIRPRYEKPRNYNHTQGVPCVQTKKIGSCTGLIQCIGADVSGITRATDLERQAIQAALCNGVYAGAGGGE